ncbi:hypothetical protein CTEN210_06410 [Chaetoceros tenuissimus]|uniref:Uncharacterized protein n=1 Tax=Chaetoceros tenuissimus TaxID=426638 RepID=A0AAD3CSL2_9STRA|nr:hypothetical protein CTEN210_06410 [Chaetoceros tenuissimus]
MNISTFQRNLDFIKSLYSNKEWKDEECKNDILKAIEECNQKIENALGKSMHILCVHKPAITAVQKVAKKFPSTLSYVQEDDGRIPIQTAAASVGFQYIPILAREGIKHNLGDEEGRGGLLVTDPTQNLGWNALQFFANVGGLKDATRVEYEKLDAMRVKVMKELQQSCLLFKKDIKEHCLLRFACNKAATQRFDFLVEWDPDALLDPKFLHQPFATQKDAASKSAILLEASLKHFPNIGGLLFVQDGQETTAFDAACAEFGTEETMKILQDILSPKCNYPILHHAFVKAPQHKDLFMEKFPWAYQLKDHNGRTLQQAVLAAGPDKMNANKILFATLTDDQIRAKDPITTLYPFAAMAVGEHADLEKTFYLLRRHPSVLDRHTRADSTIQSRQRNENGGGGIKKKRKVEK